MFEAIGTLDIMRMTGLDYLEPDGDSVLQIKDVEVHQVRNPLLVVNAEVRRRGLTSEGGVAVIWSAADAALRAGLLVGNARDVCSHVGKLLAAGADSALIAETVRERIAYWLEAEAEMLDLGSSDVRAKIIAIDLPELKRRHAAAMPAGAEAAVLAVAGSSIDVGNPHKLDGADLEGDVVRACEGENAAHYEQLVALVQRFRAQYAAFCKEFD